MTNKKIGRASDGSLPLINRMCSSAYAKTEWFMIYTEGSQNRSYIGNSRSLFSARQHMLRALLPLYAIARPSVRLSNGWISQKRLKLWLWNFHQTPVWRTDRQRDRRTAIAY